MDRCCMPEIRAVHLPMLQLQPADWELILHFIGKAGEDMHGEVPQVCTSERKRGYQRVCSWTKTILQHWHLWKSARQERGPFSFARKPGADTTDPEGRTGRGCPWTRPIFFTLAPCRLTDQPARDTTFYAVKRAKNKGSIISYDPNYRASLWENEEIAKEHMRSLIPYVDIMKISDEETELLSGYKRFREAAEELYRQGVKIVAITLGRNGTYIYNQGRRTYS